MSACNRKFAYPKMEVQINIIIPTVVISARIHMYEVLAKYGSLQKICGILQYITAEF